MLLPISGLGGLTPRRAYAKSPASWQDSSPDASTPNASKQAQSQAQAQPQPQPQPQVAPDSTPRPGTKPGMMPVAMAQAIQSSQLNLGSSSSSSSSSSPSTSSPSVLATPSGQPVRQPQSIRLNNPPRPNPNQIQDPNILYATSVSTQVTFNNEPTELKLVLYIKRCGAGRTTRLQYLANLFLRDLLLGGDTYIGYVSGYRLSKPSRNRPHVDAHAWVREWWANNSNFNVMNLAGCESMAKTLRALYQQTAEDQVVPNAGDVPSAEHRRQLSDDQGNEIVYISNIQMEPQVSPTSLHFSLVASGHTFSFTN